MLTMDINYRTLIH